MRNMPKRKFVFIVSTLVTAFLGSDLKSDNNVTIIDSYLKPPRNHILKIIQKAHTTNKINRKVGLPFRNIWKSSLRTIKWEKDIEYYIFFHGAILKTIDLEYIRSLKKNYKVKYILLLLDAWDSDTSKCAKFFTEHLGFDYIFSFDPRDVKRNGFLYTNVPYSVISPEISNTVEYDVCLIAWARGRIQKFLSVFKYLTANKISVHYRLSGIKNKEQLYKDKIIYNEYLPYSDAIEETKKCNCILEVLMEGQTGATLRYYEAICYNKKLLTNNKEVVNLPFYNPEYIHIFEKPEDIDCDWVKKRISVDYGYDGRFSLSRLMDRVIELEEKKEG